MKVQFTIPSITKWGETMLVTGNVPSLGNGNFNNALRLNYSEGGRWTGEIYLDTLPADFRYNYLLKREDNGEFIVEWGEAREVRVEDSGKDLYCFDHWNDAGSEGNVLLSSPFSRVLLRSEAKPACENCVQRASHFFRVKAPMLEKNQAVCVSGSCGELGNWSDKNAVMMMRQGDFWLLELSPDVAHESIQYKYGICEKASGKLLFYEQGDNRASARANGSYIRMEDGFVRMNYQSWRGAGVGLPVFSIRTKKSFGVGDFEDLKRLVDWAEKVDMKLIQLLPLNDTIGTHTELDVLPYAAISAFALNPLYLHLPALGKLPDSSFGRQQYIPKQAELNARELVPFLEVINFKLNYAKDAYQYQKHDFLASAEFLEFYNKNAYWLVPYAAYCLLRDRCKTNDYTQWGEFAKYDEQKIYEFSDPAHAHFDDIGVNYFIQFHLHKQLSLAGKYANDRGIILKGDIPIGINKNSVDTWVNPELFHLDMTAGAPPDMFAVKGQNWLLPTYNWDVMRETGFKWWRQRFEQMSCYFDTFRIDHILGFFRIWEIPEEQIEGIMGHLNPSIPIYLHEFEEKGIWFDYNRFCKPYITDQILSEFFGVDAPWVKANCLQIEEGWMLRLKSEYRTQKDVERMVALGIIPERLRNGIFDLISNVLLFEVSGTNGTQFYPRYAMHYQRSYACLDEHTKKGLDELYIDYYYRRQDANWYKSGMEKLPELKRATKMLICGEDLGMMNPAVTAVMKELGILSLEIQRAPKTNEVEFAHPGDAPYLSVVTPSTHDMTTIREWWEESRDVTQRFFNTQLGHWGEAPYFCEWWIAREIIEQHLYSPAIWAVFQLQDLLAMSEKLRRENPHEERINDPSNSEASWRYRMHIALEDLMREDSFNAEIKHLIQKSGR